MLFLAKGIRRRLRKRIDVSITYIWTLEGWLYLAVVLDLYSRRVVGGSMSKNIDEKLALDALNMAIVKRKPPLGIVHHSDRGCQY